MIGGGPGLIVGDVLHQTSLEGLRKPPKTPSQYIQCSGLNSNKATAEYKSIALQLQKSVSSAGCYNREDNNLNFFGSEKLNSRM
jgi:hypothetical protein